MNGHRDIERTLDAWFVDGPMVMPDRLFDVVLDQVERVPQRRLARLSLRYAEMNPRSRLFTVLAAALLVVAAIAVIGGGSPGLVSSSPSLPPSSPTTSASQSLTDLPAELTDRYIGPLRTVEGLETGDVARLRLNARSFAYDNGSRQLLQSRAGVDGDDLVLVSTTSVGCQEGDEGRYPFSTSPGGSILTIVAGIDDCAVRLAAVAGTWQRVGCRSLDRWCLGVVEAGTYRSQYFDPYATTTAEALPEYGHLTWTVPDGWANEADEPSRYGFMRAPSYQAGGTNDGQNPPDNIALLARASAAALHVGCPDGVPEPGVDKGRADLEAWLVAHPGLVVTKQPAITIDGVTASVLDIAVAADWTETCDPENPFIAAPLFVGDYHWAIAQNDRMRLILLDLGASGTVVIDIDPEDASTFDQLLAETMPIVESFDFN